MQACNDSWHGAVKMLGKLLLLQSMFHTGMHTCAHVPTQSGNFSENLILGSWETLWHISKDKRESHSLTAQDEWSLSLPNIQDSLFHIQLLEYNLSPLSLLVC